MKTELERRNRALWSACMGNMSTAASFRLQAIEAVNQNQSLAAFVSHCHPSNRRKAKAAYDLAVAELPMTGGDK